MHYGLTSGNSYSFPKAQPQQQAMAANAVQMRLWNSLCPFTDDISPPSLVIYNSYLSVLERSSCIGMENMHRDADMVTTQIAKTVAVLITMTS